MKAPSSAEPEADELLVHLAISSLGDVPDATDDSYDDDSRLKLEACDVGGKVAIYVNGSPVAIHFKGAMIEPIGDLLLPGRNVVRFSGRHTSHLFAKVVGLDRSPPYLLRTVYAKRRLLPSDDNVEIDFNIGGVPQRGNYEVLADDPNGQEEVRKSVSDVVKKMAEAWNRHDAEHFFGLAFPEALTPPGKRRDDKRAYIETTLAKVGNPRYALQTDPTEVKLLIGKRTVLAYSGFEPTLGMTYIFRAETEDEYVFVTRYLVFVRQRGMWTVR